MTSFRSQWVPLVLGAISFSIAGLTGCGSTYPGGWASNEDPSLIAGGGGTGASIAGRGTTAGSGATGGWSGVAGGIPAGRGGGPWAGGTGVAASGGWGGPTAGIGGFPGTGGSGTFSGDRDADGFDVIKDCNDLDPNIYPGALDSCCDFVDNDCDGQDGQAGGRCRCDPNGDRVDRDRDGVSAQRGDCNDLDASFYPGNPQESCCDGLDNNCDGQDDPVGVACECTWDWDGDGYYAGPFGAKGDCNDWDASINPGSGEICDDNIDNDCDGLYDWQEPCVSIDFDGDGYGWGSDCDDWDVRVNPGAPEICGDGRDNNCNGAFDGEDPACGRVYQDFDGDGYSVEVDCNDWSPWVNPGMAEVCGDGQDNNCDGLVDPYPQCTDQQVDWDRDGYPAAKDCDDGNAATYPGSPYEVCCDGVDSDCDGTDVSAGVMCTCGSDGDADGDGYVVGFAPPGQADCNDQDAQVNPGAAEVCFDGRDNNCNGLVDGAERLCEVILD